MKKSGHWVWTGSYTQNGPWASSGRETQCARRLAWQAWIGPVPRGCAVVGTCGCHECVNPDHSECLTWSDLRKRDVRKRGNKLDVDQVSVIKSRLQNGETPADIARSIGVNYKCIYLIHVGKQTLEMPGLPGGSASVNRLIIAKGDLRQLVYYWYQSRGRVIARDWQKILYVGWDRAMRGRTDGSLVRFSIQIGRKSGDEAAEKAFRALAPQVVALLPDYVPN